MQENIETELVRLRNELRSQKQASELGWGQLAPSGETPTASWNGSIDLTAPLINSGNGIDGTMCRFIARFTRNDGKTTPPVVDFGVDFSVSPSGVTMERNNGATITVANEKPLIEQGVEVGLLNTGSDYSELQIDFPFNDYTGLHPNFYALLGQRYINLQLNVSGYSPVKGLLQLRRVTSV